MTLAACGSLKTVFNLPMPRKDNSNSIASRLLRIELDEGTAYDCVRGWFSLSNIQYADAVTKIEEEFGLKTSETALVAFFQKHCVGFKNKLCREHAAEVKAMYAADPEFDFNELTLKQIEQRAFEEAFAKDADISDLEKLSRMLGDSARLKLAQRKLELDVDKWRSAAKADIEKGLDALLDEIKGNSAALELFEKMKAIVLNSVEVTAV